MLKAKDNEIIHKPVLVEEALGALKLENTAHLKFRPLIIDTTLGMGGHTKEFVKAGAHVIALEGDRTSLVEAEKRLEKEFLLKGIEGVACPDGYIEVSVPDLQLSFRQNTFFDKYSYLLIHSNFKDIDKIFSDLSLRSPDGVFFDLGISSFQLSKKMRGFSFQDLGAPLDMRIDESSQGLKASDLLMALDRTQLTRLFSEVMPIYNAKKIASAVIAQRDIEPIQTVGDFLSILEKTRYSKSHLHFATLPFLALRIGVNSELDNLSEALEKAFELLKKGGRIAVISFHSGEDSLVKRIFSQKVKENKGLLINKKPILPTAEEVSTNPRARSAKLRTIEKL